MPEGLKIFLRVVIAFFVAIWLSVVALFLTALLYLATGEAAADFHRTIFNPTMNMAAIVYVAYLIATWVWAYVLLGLYFNQPVKA